RMVCRRRPAVPRVGCVSRMEPVRRSVRLERCRRHDGLLVGTGPAGGCLPRRVRQAFLLPLASAVHSYCKGVISDCQSGMSGTVAYCLRLGSSLRNNIKREYMQNGKIGVTTENIFPIIKKFLY